MIIIEGSDCLGKTTLAKWIAKQTGLTYRHMTRPGPDFGWRAEDYLEGVADLTVCDRFHLGGLVYHELGESFKTKGEFGEVQKAIFLDRLALVIVLYSESDQYYEQEILANSDKQEMFSSDRLVEANKGFRRLAAHPWWPVVHHRHDVWSKGYVTEEVARKWVEEWAGLLSSRRDFLTSSGFLTA